MWTIQRAFVNLWPDFMLNLDGVSESGHDGAKKSTWWHSISLVFCAVALTANQGQAEVKYQNVDRQLSGSWNSVPSSCLKDYSESKFVDFPGSYTEKHEHFGCDVVPYGTSSHSIDIRDSGIQLNGSLAFRYGGAGSQLKSQFSLTKPSFFRLDTTIAGSQIAAGSRATTRGSAKLLSGAEVVVDASRPFFADFGPVIIPDYHHSASGVLAAGDYSLEFKTSGFADGGSSEHKLSFRVYNEIPTLPVTFSSASPDSMAMNFGPRATSLPAGFFFPRSRPVTQAVGICLPGSDPNCLTRVSTLELKSDQPTRFEARLNEVRLASSEPLVVTDSTGVERPYLVVVTGKPKSWADSQGGLIELVTGEVGGGKVGQIQLAMDWIYEFIPSGSQLGNPTNPKLSVSNPLKLSSATANIPAEPLLEPGDQIPDGLRLAWNGATYQAMELSTANGALRMSILVPEPHSVASPLFLFALLLSRFRRS